LSPGSGLKKKTANQDLTNQYARSRVGFLIKRRDTLSTEVKSHSKPQSVKGGGALGQARANILYSFKNEHVVSLFKLLQKSNKLKLPEARRPEEVEKIDDPTYCLYHRMLGHPTKNCYIFKDVL